MACFFEVIISQLVLQLCCKQPNIPSQSETVSVALIALELTRVTFRPGLDCTCRAVIQTLPNNRVGVTILDLPVLLMDERGEREARGCEVSSR